MTNGAISQDDVKKIAKLANLPIDQNEVGKFADQFSQTIEVINNLSEVDTSGISPTYQVNNLQNISRDDVIDTTRVLPQEVAIREAKKTNQGYIIVDRVIDNS